MKIQNSHHNHRKRQDDLIPRVLSIEMDPDVLLQCSTFHRIDAQDVDSLKHIYLFHLDVWRGQNSSTHSKAFHVNQHPHYGYAMGLEDLEYLLAKFAATTNKKTKRNPSCFEVLLVSSKKQAWLKEVKRQ
mmetsp:Transcript_27927/g.36144  ORF Transcript_27927/g.36144 Transcript_27927/m.36144 type:complete len:130 (+) Transcript_27927:184-573(+)